MISIHALLAESDLIFTACHMAVRIFLSTLSLRRATPKRQCTLYGRLYFYPRSPCGERRFPVSTHRFDGRISIHALLAESDHWEYWVGGYGTAFLSTLSLRRATIRAYQRYFPPDISIHALLAESDTYHFMLNIGTLHFYPRSPCGERRTSVFRGWTLNIFLSTLSLRRATQLC